MTRAKLMATYVAILLIGLLILAAVAVLALDRTQRSSLDARLQSEAKATAVFADVHHGALSVDAEDRTQFVSVLGVGSDGVIFDLSGTPVLSDGPVPKDLILPGAASSETYFSSGGGERAIRGYSTWLVRDGRRVGAIAVWRGSDYIDESDRNAAIAFSGAAVIIALLALLAANLVTRRALEDAFARQRRFTADASHELRAPLAVIRAEADLALRKERPAEEYRAAMQTIGEEADRIESLIGDLLSSARAESRVLKRERVDLGELVAAVSKRLEPTLAAKQGALSVAAGQPAHVLADAHALERAMLAVGHNAVQHVGQGGRVQMSLSQNGAWAVLDVDDDGPGFSEAALRHAFDRFWREGGVRDHGSGLGLAIAKSIVESFGGQIGLSNRPGGGARVRMRLPARV